MKRKHRYLLYLCWIGVVTIVLSACSGTGDLSPTPGSFNFQVKVIDVNENPIRGARVELAIDGRLAALSGETLGDGYAIIDIDASRMGKLARLEISANGYKPYSQYVNFREDVLPKRVTLESVTSGAQSQAVIGEGAEEVVATSQPTPTYTPTSTPTEIPTVQPTETTTPTATLVIPTITPTPTATPTSTNTPTPLPLEPPRVKAVTGTILVLAGPDIQNEALGTLVYQEEGEIVGKTKNGEWLEIITSQGKQGWVAPCEVELVNGNLDEVPVTWERSVTPYDCSGTPPSPLPLSSCLVIDISQAEVFNKPFDDVTLNWRNVPDGAVQLYLSVYRTTGDGERVYAVYPTFSDTVTPYFIGEWMFENTGAASGTSFMYEIEVRDASDKTICKTSGTLAP